VDGVYGVCGVYGNGMEYVTPQPCPYYTAILSSLNIIALNIVTTSPPNTLVYNDTPVNTSFMMLLLLPYKFGVNGESLPTPNPSPEPNPMVFLEFSIYQKP